MDRVDSYELLHWRAATFIAAAERGREPLTTVQRNAILVDHFPEMSSTEIVMLESGAIVILRAIGMLVNRYKK